MSRGTLSVLMLMALVLVLALWTPADAACAPGTIPGQCWPISDVTGPGWFDNYRLYLPTVTAR